MFLRLEVGASSVGPFIFVFCRKYHLGNVINCLFSFHFAGSFVQLPLKIGTLWKKGYEPLYHTYELIKSIIAPSSLSK